jgi:hypothetical protein
MAALQLGERTALPLTEISAFALRQGEAPIRWASHPGDNVAFVRGVST